VLLLSALAACRGQYGSNKRIRPSVTKSARSLAMISSAASGAEISPTAAVAILASRRNRLQTELDSPDRRARVGPDHCRRSSNRRDRHHHALSRCDKDAVSPQNPIHPAPSRWRRFGRTMVDPRAIPDESHLWFPTGSKCGFQTMRHIGRCACCSAAKELVDEIAVRGMQLQDLEPRIAGAARRLAEGISDLGNQCFIHLAQRGLAVPE
jgi:hypothetical protein